MRAVRERTHPPRVRSARRKSQWLFLSEERALSRAVRESHDCGSAVRVRFITALGRKALVAPACTKFLLFI